MDWFNHLGFWLGLLIKLLGYTVFLKLWLGDRIIRSLGIAAFRSMIGVAEMLLLLDIHSGHHPTDLFYLELIASRLLIWGAIGLIFYRYPLKGRLAIFVSCGTLVSCLLDIPTLLGWIAFEGWIC